MKAEILHTCDRCQRSGFTAAGLSRHACRPVTPSPMATTSKNETSALAVLTEKQMSTAVDLSRLQAIAIQQLAMVKILERDAALRAILVGVSLHRIKASLKHGEFKRWISSHIKGTGYKQCYFYMRLAAVFVEKTRVTRPEMLALPGEQKELQLEPADAVQRRFMEKAAKFVGELSLNELLAEHGIKDRKNLGGSRGSNDAAEPTSEQLAMQARSELSDFISRGQSLLVEDNAWQHLTAEEIRAGVEQLEHLVKKVREGVKPLLK